MDPCQRQCVFMELRECVLGRAVVSDYIYTVSFGLPLIHVQEITVFSFHNVHTSNVSSLLRPTGLGSNRSPPSTIKLPPSRGSKPHTDAVLHHPLQVGQFWSRRSLSSKGRRPQHASFHPFKIKLVRMCPAACFTDASHTGLKSADGEQSGRLKHIGLCRRHHHGNY